jgi:hypothetical protein
MIKFNYGDLVNMTMNRTALASAMALALAGGSAWAVTSTEDVAVILDKTEVRAGEIVNMSIMGLNNGEIDLKGEEDGAIIIATVKSKLGKVTWGSLSPGELPRDTVDGGVFTPFSVIGGDTDNEPNVKYIKLTQGVGRVNIEYPIDAQYQDEKGNPISDEITVTLQQRFALGGSQVQFDDIAAIGVFPNNDCPSSVFGGTNACPYKAKPVTVKIQPPSTDPGGLDIVAFIPAGETSMDPRFPALQIQARDPRGLKDEFLDAEPNGIYDNDDGIQGGMTVGTRDGVIIVEAQNRSINGLVKVTLTEISDVMARNADGTRLLDHYVPNPQEYTFTASMVQGKAYVRLDSSVVKAADYYIKAEFRVVDAEGKEEYKYSSVDMVYRDTLKVHSTGKPTGLVLLSLKDRIKQLETPVASTSCDVKAGTPIMVNLVDEYGNMTTNNALLHNGTVATAIPVKVTDSSGIAKEFTVEIDPNTGMAQPWWLGDSAGEISKDEGLIALKGTATINGNTVNSNAVSIAVKKETLKVEPIFSGPAGAPRAGDDFDFAKVWAMDKDGKEVAPSRIEVQNVSTQEKSVVRRNDGTRVVETRFTQATIIQAPPLGDPADGDTDMWSNWFIVSDEDKMFPQMICEAPVGIGTNAGVSVELHNAHNESLTLKNADGKVETKVPSPKRVADKNILTIAEFGFKMEDCFGNAITGRNAIDKVGTLRATTPNADIKYNTPEGSYAVPGQDDFWPRGGVQKSSLILTYPKSTEKEFTGDDTIAVRFTKAGLVAGPCQTGQQVSGAESGTDPFVIMTTIEPFLDKNRRIEAYIDGKALTAEEIVKVPVNGEVPLTLESLVEDGKDKEGNDLFRLFTDFENIRVQVTIDTMDNEVGWKPDVREVIPVMDPLFGLVFTETKVSHGAILDLTTNQLSGKNGRDTFVVYGGPVPRKPFKIIFTNMKDPTQSITRIVEITQTYQPGKADQGACSSTNPAACQTDEECAGAGGVFIEGSDLLTTACNLVPQLVHEYKGKAASIDKDAYQDFRVGANFSGGVSVNGGVFRGGPVGTEIGGAEMLTFAGNIEVDPKHVGKKANLLFVAGIEPPPEAFQGPYDYEGGTDVVYKAVRADGSAFDINLYASQEEWPAEAAKLTADPFKEDMVLTTYISLNLWSGQLGPILKPVGLTNARIYVFYGYVLNEGDEEGKIIYNGQPIVVTMK